MRIDAFHPNKSARPNQTNHEGSGFREILESIGRYEQNAEHALRRASRGEAQFSELIALQMEVQMWSQSTDLFSRVAGQVSRSAQELARSTQ